MTEQRRFKLLKDLPDTKAGTESKPVININGNVHFPNSENIMCQKKNKDRVRYTSYPIKLVQSMPDWFEEIKPQKYVTVPVGWRGSLRRKLIVNDCIFEAELIARTPTFFLIIHTDGTFIKCDNCKFLPFSIDNPPPRDWLAETSYGTRYFDKVVDFNFYFFNNGNSSRVETDSMMQIVTEWLDIEEVE